MNELFSHQPACPNAPPRQRIIGECTCFRDGSPERAELERFFAGVKSWAVVEVDNPEAITGDLFRALRERRPRVLFAIVGEGFTMPEDLALVYGADPPPFAPGEVVANYAQHFVTFGKRLVVFATPEQAPRVRERLTQLDPGGGA